MVPAYPAKAKSDKNNQNKQILTGTVIQCMEMIEYFTYKAYQLVLALKKIAKH